MCSSDLQLRSAVDKLRCAFGQLRSYCARLVNCCAVGQMPRVWTTLSLAQRDWPNAQIGQMRLTNILVVQHLTNCAIFGQLHSALAIGLGIRLGLGLGLELGLGLVLELGLGQMCSAFGQMHKLTKCTLLAPE